jgi:2-keto-3-deoxy-L-rhamnonate aldolase RhmA
MCDNGAGAPVTVGSVERARKLLWEYRRQMNALKDSIKSGRTVVGTTATPNVDVSILADAGYDFVLLDTQHSAWGIKQLQPSIHCSASLRVSSRAPLPTFGSPEITRKFGRGAPRR